MHDNGGGGLGAIALAFEEIRVDLRELADFAALVRGETEQNLRPHARTIIDTYLEGVRFGERSASGEMFATRQTYAACLDRSVANLRNYVQASAVLITAVLTMCEEYGRADRDGAARAPDRMTQIAEAQTALADASGRIEAQRIAAAHVANLPPEARAGGVP
jgi:hypothetical protein